MKKPLIVILALALTILLLFVAYHYFTEYRISKNAVGALKTRIADLKGKVSTEDLSSYFDQLEGCFILYDKNKGTYLIFNQEKSQVRVTPCSTFKIVNSLIGLETGVLQNENTSYKWDGKHYSIPEWNRDQTMSSAFKNSVVWYYQKVAANIGMDNMQKYMNTVGYGNADISGGLTAFWLNSSLKISPLEQIELLKNLYSYKLPFSKCNIDIVKKIMAVSDSEGVKISGKTGAGIETGWFVGYVENGNDVFFFSTNIEGKNGATGYNARNIAFKILKDKKIIK